MTELPSGTVSFLFSDVEGSTRLLTRLRERYADVLAEHHGLLRAAFEEHQGREVHTEGDAFFVAFARASDAIAAAVSVQRTLASHRWPEGVQLRVRIGIHTGEAEVQLDDYVGLDVHRAARICSAGHGGQVLISSATRELVADELPADVALRDLGEHRLKDLDRPERLFELVVGDLPSDFPPPASLSAGSGGADGLPPSPNRTIGRAEDVRAIRERLRADGVRRLTLTGPGGVGKTRLGLEAARAAQADFAEGARFVSLAALREAGDVPSAIIQSLGIVPLSGESPEQAVTRFLSAKHLLLVLDSFEHLLPAARLVSDLLGACSALTVLATSREPLGLQAEERYPVSALASVDAIALFCERARAHDPGFDVSDGGAAAVAEICRRLDGLPLAIELAAARCGLLSPSEIAERLDAALVALGSGARDAPARQRTLRATVDWSHDLLSDDEKQCFVRFAVFAGGASVEAAQAVTGAGLDTLDQLVAKSLLVRRRQAHTPTRLQMLETIRAYAAERFASDADADAVRERHFRHFLTVAERHGTDQLLFGVTGKEHLSRLDKEIHNFDAALRWAVGRPDAGPALAMVGALGWYWDLRERYAADAVAWIDRALALPGVEDHPAEQARALLAKPFLRRGEGRRDRPGRPRSGGRIGEGSAILAEAEAVARAHGDPLVLAKVLNGCSAWWSIAGRSDVAATLADEALRCAMAADDEWEIAQAWAKKAAAVSDLVELRERVDRAASLLEDVGNVERLGQLFCNAAYNALIMGGDRDARAYADRAAPIVQDLDNPGTWMDLCGTMGLAALFTGATDAARDAFREELELCRRLIALPNASEGLLGLAAVAVVDGDLSDAARLRGAAGAHSYGQQQDDVDARLEAAFFAAARTRHGADAWDTAVREGARLSFEDAIAHALQQPPAPSVLLLRPGAG
jgi:predicted ATPase/class 3 adenylate cyclase